MIDLNKFCKNANKTKLKNESTSEFNIESEFCKYAKTKNCKALKLAFVYKKGFPDRTVILPSGKVFFIEFKRKNKKQSATQKLTQRMLENFNFKYFVCDKIGQAEEILDFILAC
jgi:hypothetical protein